ncbi:MAG: hypothetical protein LBS95_01560 [Mycoplasmataceae bacterium]|jgi:hypothetical protein|nr:hypothetical protein [Mycoplasmataceae bacterium]
MKKQNVTLSEIKIRIANEEKKKNISLIEENAKNAVQHLELNNQRFQVINELKHDIANNDITIQKNLNLAKNKLKFNLENTILKLNEMRSEELNDLEAQYKNDSASISYAHNIKQSMSNNESAELESLETIEHDNKKKKIALDKKK